MGVQTGGAGHSNVETSPDYVPTATTGDLFDDQIDFADATGSVVGYKKAFSITPTSANANVHSGYFFESRIAGTYNVTGDVAGLVGQVALDSTATGTHSFISALTGKVKVQGASTATEASAVRLAYEVDHASGVVTTAYGLDWLNHTNSGTISNTYAMLFEASSDWLTTDNEITALVNATPYYVPMSSTAEQITYSRSFVDANKYALRVGVGLGADVDGVSGVNVVWTPPAAGLAGGNSSSLFVGSGTGDGDDTSHEVIFFNAFGFDPNGGATDASAFGAGTGFTYLIAAESGDLDFIDYTPTLISEWEGNITASTEFPAIYMGDAGTKTWATGALTNQREFYFKAPTLAFAGASTVTAAATVYIDRAPQAGANATLTESFALWVDDGDCRFDGLILADGGIIVPNSTANVSDPPTDAELDAAFGDAASLEDGYVVTLDDNGAATDSYICWVMSNKWFYCQGTLAL